MANKKKPAGLLFDEILPQAQRAARSLFSLDPQEDVPASQQALEMALGFVPVIGQAMALRDIERARRAGDPAEAALAATEFIPFGRAISAMRRAPTMEIAEYDPRFSNSVFGSEPRVGEQPRLKALERTVESRGTINPPEVSITQFEGRPFITSMSDRTAAGGLLRAINDVELARPINLQGGQDFMFENPGMVWASQKSASSKVDKAAKALKEEFGQDPIYLPWRMAPTGGDFATMTGETMLSYADVALNKKTKNRADAMIKKMIPNWSGIGSEESVKQFRNAPDAVRKEIKNNLDIEFRKEGGLSVGEARLSVADPRQYTAPESGLQNVGVIYADKPLIERSGHASYDTGIPGEGIGRLKEDLRVYQLLEQAAKARGIADPRNPSAADVRALQMKPYGGMITSDLLKKLGY